MHKTSCSVLLEVPPCSFPISSPLLLLHNPSLMPLLQSSSPCQSKQFQLHAVGIFKLNSYRQLLCMKWSFHPSKERFPKRRRKSNRHKFCFQRQWKHAKQRKYLWQRKLPGLHGKLQQAPSGCLHFQDLYLLQGICSFNTLAKPSLVSSLTIIMHLSKN